MARHVFLTGPPGVGKTTLIRKASELLQSSGVPVDGFYTEEVRQGGRRTGFDVVTLSGARGPLSRVGSEPQPGKRDYRVGQYVVDLTSFEQLALPVLKNAGSSGGPGQRVCVIDEIGKMELFSQPFILAVRQTLSSPGTVVLGTIPVPKGKPLALVEEIRSRPDVKVFSVSKPASPSVCAKLQMCTSSSASHLQVLEPKRDELTFPELSSYLSSMTEQIVGSTEGLLPHPLPNTAGHWTHLVPELPKQLISDPQLGFRHKQMWFCGESPLCLFLSPSFSFMILAIEPRPSH
ncbi:cancer-related nucleoside-triphosphatase isoform X1 [Fukomys damarensis]|uniref:cancer-related nucleoside-triphosphatase isoform X1 n=1 Tax=Fukomys damarensis TaxID=885580 RepID=UPI001454E9E9|nr:cancer-related nucleoside-triphosphatase isoform X1 [Fukomys damarensis]